MNLGKVSPNQLVRMERSEVYGATFKFPSVSYLSVRNLYDFYKDIILFSLMEPMGIIQDGPLQVLNGVITPLNIYT